MSVNSDLFTQRFLQSSQITSPMGTPGLTGADAWQSRFTPVSNGIGLGGSAPAVTTQSQSQPQQSSGNDYQSQWNAAGNTGQVPAGWHGESGGSSYSGPDYNALIAQVQSDIDQEEADTQAAYQTQMTAQGANKTAQLSDLEATNQSRLGEYATQNTQAQQDKKSSYAEARRLASEQLQGIQSKFGGTTGTGAFYSEILGSSLYNYLGKVNQSADRTFTSISKATNDWKNQVVSESNKIEANYQDNMAQLQTSLNSDLTKLRNAKTQVKIDTLNSYRDQMAQAESQRNQYMQQLALQKLQGDQALEQLKAQQVYKYLYSKPGTYKGVSGTDTSTGTTQAAGNNIIQLPDGSSIDESDPNYEYWKQMYGGA